MRSSFLRLSFAGLTAIGGSVYYMQNNNQFVKSSNETISVGPLQKAVCAETISSSSPSSQALVNGYFPSTHPLPSTKWDFNWDNRQPRYMVKPSAYDEADQETRKEMLKKVTPTAKRNIILIRHGQYELEDKSKNYLSLTPLGREQAVHLGRRLAACGVKFDSLVMSTMPRAVETANLILNQLPPIPTKSDSLLEEGAPFPPEPPSANWRPRSKNFATEGSRIEAAFRKYLHRASYKQKNDSWELIVCHGNVIRYFVCRALQFPPEGWLRMSIGHCSLTWIIVYPNGIVSVRAFGDIGHLPPDKVSF